MLKNITLTNVVIWPGYRTCYYDLRLEHDFDLCCDARSYRTFNWHMMWGYWTIDDLDLCSWVIGHDRDLCCHVNSLLNMQLTYDLRLLGYRTWLWLMLWCDQAIEKAICIWSEVTGLKTWPWSMMWCEQAIEHAIDIWLEVTGL